MERSLSSGAGAFASTHAVQRKSLLKLCQPARSTKRSVSLGCCGRPIRYLLPGTRVTEVLRTLAGGELRALRTAAELTPAQLASRLGVSAGAIRGWETGSATIPLARASEIRRVVEDRGRETSPTDEAAREILAVVARHPDIGRTELFEHHVGDRELSRAGLVRALEDGLVHEILVELPRRGPYYGLRAGRPELTPEPAWGGADLRRERQVLGLTQHELARAVGVTTSTVSGWETGKRIPGHRAAALARRSLSPLPGPRAMSTGRSES